MSIIPEDSFFNYIFQMLTRKLRTYPGLLTVTFVFLVNVLLIGSAARAQSLPTKALVGLESPKERVRIVSIAAIRKSQDRRARRILEGMLRDDSPSVRAAAAENLGLLGDRQALAALEKSANDKSALVKKSVQKAMAQLTDEANQQTSTKAIAAAPKNAIPTEVSFPTTNVAEFPKERLRDLQQAVIQTLKKAKKRSFFVQEKGLSKGFGLRLSVQTHRTYKQGNATIVEVQCRLNLVRLPSNTLRLSSKAVAGVGIEGTLSPKEKAQLTKEAILQCAPELANDYEDYAFSRIP